MNTKGKNDDLRGARLKEATDSKDKKTKMFSMEEMMKMDATMDATTKRKKQQKNETAGYKLFPAKAYWRPLKRNEKTVEETTNPTFLTTCGPTTAAKDADVDCFEHNYDEHVDIPMVAATTRKVRPNRAGHIVGEKEKVDGHWVPKYDTSIRKKGMVNPKFKEKHKLSLKPLPYEIVDMFLPLHRKGKGISPNNKKKGQNPLPSFCGEFQTICDWKNLKAGKKHGTYYPDFVDFTPRFC